MAPVFIAKSISDFFQGEETRQIIADIELTLPADEKLRSTNSDVGLCHVFAQGDAYQVSFHFDPNEIDSSQGCQNAYSLWTQLPVLFSPVLVNLYVHCLRAKSARRGQRQLAPRTPAGRLGSGLITGQCSKLPHLSCALVASSEPPASNCGCCGSCGGVGVSGHVHQSYQIALRLHGLIVGVGLSQDRTMRLPVTTAAIVGPFYE